MTDLTALTAIGTPVLSDLMYVVDDPASTKLPRKITLQQIKDLFKAVAETLTNKSISFGSNTITTTKAQLSTAVTDGTPVYTSDNLSALATSTKAQLDSHISDATIVDTSDNLSALAATTSAQLAGVISDETGTDKLVFSAAPVVVAPSISYTLNAQTVTTYTPVLLDAGKIVTCSNAAAITFTIPPNSSVAYPIGSSIEVISIGAGLTSFAQGSGVTINSTGATPTAPTIRAQYSSATAIKTATDTWIIVGDIV